MELRRSERRKAKIKLGVQGPSGSGKTFSALHIAIGLTQDWSKIAVIDTENCSSDLYSNLGNYNVLSITKPFSPEKYIQAIEVCENSGMEVIIIDSISHEWEGPGGILEVHGNMPGNSFTNWSKLTPRHNAFVQKMLQTQMHVIACIRTKQDYVLSEKNGKIVPEKVGLKGVTRDGMDYELTVVFDLDIKHNASASKDRTGLFMDKPQFVISESTGTEIRNWCNQGIDVDLIIQQINLADQIEQLKKIYADYPQLRVQLEPELIKRKSQIEMNSRPVLTH
jgi:hypothetical protein